MRIPAVSAGEFREPAAWGFSYFLFIFNADAALNAF